MILTNIQKDYYYRNPEIISKNPTIKFIPCQYPTFLL